MVRCFQNQIQIREKMNKQYHLLIQSSREALFYFYKQQCGTNQRITQQYTSLTTVDPTGFSSINNYGEYSISTKPERSTIKLQRQYKQE